VDPDRNGDRRESAAELFAALRESYRLLGELLDRHRNYLLKIISEEARAIDPRLAARQGASDIVHTALTRILENFHRATEGVFAVGSEDDLRRWLRRVCLNTLAQEVRDEGRQVRDFRRDQPIPERFDGRDDGPSPSSACGLNERVELLREAVNALPESDRILLRLFLGHEWTYTGLAGLVSGEATDAGRVAMRRRLTQLQFRLGKDDSAPDCS
jgi:DNA-directed RNA polymerase specialized sigma24 family protein